MSVQTGQAAPDFELFTSQKEPFKLSDQQGNNVLILFFPGAFTSGCADELNAVNNDLESFGVDTVVVGISTDSPFAQAEFSKVNGFKFPLLSDHNATVCAAYGAKFNNNFTDMKLDRIAQRAAFVVDKMGILRYAEVTANAGIHPNFEAVKQILSDLG